MSSQTGPWMLIPNNSIITIASDNTDDDNDVHRLHTRRDPIEATSLSGPPAIKITSSPAIVRRRSSFSGIAPAFNMTRFAEPSSLLQENRSTDDLRYRGTAITRAKCEHPHSVQTLLRSKIKEVQVYVRKTRQAFREVDDQLPGLDALPKGVQEEWTNIMKVKSKIFEDTLAGSRILAMTGHQIISDFLDTVLPHLLSESNAKDKKIKALEHYDEEMKKGKDFAENVERAFSDLQNRIAKFKGLCARFTSKLKDNIKASGRELAKLKSCFRTVRNCFSRILSRRPQRPKSPLTNHGGEETSTSSTATDTQRTEKAITVFKEKADAVSTNVAELNTLWSLMVLEWHTVKTSLRFTKDSKQWMNESVLDTKLDDMRLRYRTLQECLEGYAMALLPTG
ncbi:hypothetical protein SCHPADRAFT_896401 [Schizopora paradoxa]|uniref:Uncharacterized protein n=1 Tax=Schizopora paradoxa TaxID=27342 RepID=A0A0H2RKC1_9AGAM|nr:hypothetical protein SCHPADRAFT_896401 [Schizopora paradoxa]